MGKGYFDIKRDIEIEKAGGFFCEACLVGKPMDDQSPDPRYCLSCYELLIKEAELDSSRRKKDWYPKKPAKEVAHIPMDVRRNMSTINAQKTEVDIITPAVATRPITKRGPKFTELPDDLISQWVGEGLGSKAIAARLRDKGIEISYKTVQRRLQGVLQI